MIFVALPTLVLVVFLYTLFYIVNLMIKDSALVDTLFLIPLGASGIVVALITILVASWYIFIYVIAVDQDLEFWDVMEESRAIAFNQPYMAIRLALFVLIISAAELVAPFVGYLFAFPYSVCVVSAAYRQMRPLDTERIEGGFTDAQDIPPPPI